MGSGQSSCSFLWVVVPSLTYSFKTFLSATGWDLSNHLMATMGTGKLSSPSTLSLWNNNCLGSNSRIRSSGVSPGIHKQLYVLPFLNSSLSVFSPVFFSSPGLFFLVLSPKSWGFIYTITPPPCCTSPAVTLTSWTKGQGEKGREKAKGGTLPSWGYIASG